VKYGVFILLVPAIFMLHGFSQDCFVENCTWYKCSIAQYNNIKDQDDDEQRICELKF